MRQWQTKSETFKTTQNAHSKCKQLMRTHIEMAMMCVFVCRLSFSCCHSYYGHERTIHRVRVPFTCTYFVGFSIVFHISIRLFIPFALQFLDFFCLSHCKNGTNGKSERNRMCKYKRIKITSIRDDDDVLLVCACGSHCWTWSRSKFLAIDKVFLVGKISKDQIYTATCSQKAKQSPIVKKLNKTLFNLWRSLRCTQPHVSKVSPQTQFINDKTWTVCRWSYLIGTEWKIWL